MSSLDLLRVQALASKLVMSLKAPSWISLYKHAVADGPATEEVVVGSGWGAAAAPARRAKVATPSEALISTTVRREKRGEEVCFL
jgi:hypothetical protein